jgi:TRAP-type C4-dicarboxylate transport system permease small subunit
LLFTLTTFSPSQESDLRILQTLANLCAILAGLLLTVITLITCGNLILRNTTGDSMAGAFEMTAVATGAAIALFMPLAQIRQGHIIVDFFTTKLSDATNDKLDKLGAFVLALVFTLLSWRTSLGGMSAFTANSQTMLLGFPEWIVYAAMVPPFALSAAIGFYQSLFGFHLAVEKTA